MTIMQQWENVDTQIKKLKNLMNYEKRGLITKDELKRLIDEQELENSVSSCCAAPLDISKSFCSDCSEHV